MVWHELLGVGDTPVEYEDLAILPDGCLVLPLGNLGNLQLLWPAVAEQEKSHQLACYLARKLVEHWMDEAM